MKYIKISDHEVKAVDEKIYNLNTLREEIISLRREYNNWRFLEYPKERSDLLEEAIDDKNRIIDAERATIEDILVSKQRLLEEIEKYV